MGFGRRTLRAACAFRGGRQRQVLHDLEVQVPHELEEEVKRLLPPPMPNEDRSLSTSPLWHERQRTFFSSPRRTRASKRHPHFRHENS